MPTAERIETEVRAETVRATVSLRANIPAGVVFLEEGIPEYAANALTNGGGPIAVEVRPWVEPEPVLATVGALEEELENEDGAASEGAEVDEQ